MSFFRGRKEQFQQVPTKTGGQMDFLSQLLGGLGGGGLAGQGQEQALQHLIGILSGSPGSFQAMEQPARTAFQQQTIPSILERFSGAGARGSSGLQQTLGQAGSQLEEGLAAQRAGMQQGAAQSLLGNFLQQGQMGLGANTFENVFRPAQPGFGQNVLSALGPMASAAGGAFGGPIGAMAGQGLAGILQRMFGGQGQMGGQRQF